MRINLHADWRRILRHAYSVRFMVLGIALQAPYAFSQVAPDLSPYLPDLAEFFINLAVQHPAICSAMSMLSIAGALLTRILPQKEFTDADPQDPRQ